MPERDMYHGPFGIKKNKKKGRGRKLGG